MKSSHNLFILLAGSQGTCGRYLCSRGIARYNGCFQSYKMYHLAKSAKSKRALTLIKLHTIHK